MTIEKYLDKCTTLSLSLTSFLQSLNDPNYRAVESITLVSGQLCDFAYFEKEIIDFFQKYLYQLNPEQFRNSLIFTVELAKLTHIEEAFNHLKNNLKQQLENSDSPHVVRHRKLSYFDLTQIVQQQASSLNKALASWEQNFMPLVEKQLLIFNIEASLSPNSTAEQATGLTFKL